MNKHQEYHKNMTNVMKAPNRDADANIKRHLENLEKAKEKPEEKKEDLDEE